jgi:hypothetical protein
LMEDGDFGVAVMVLATSFVESFSGVKPTFRTLSLGGEHLSDQK